MNKKIKKQVTAAFAIIMILGILIAIVMPLSAALNFN